MATNQLALFNIALAAVGERTLDSSQENRPVRRELEKVWDRGDGAVRYCLEQGLWNFAATRAIVSASTAVPAFEYNFSSSMPANFVRLAMVSSSSEMKDPLIKYEIEGSAILSNTSVVYMRYISDSTSFGGNLALWPETFTLYVGHWLATQVYATVENPKITLGELQDRSNAILTSARQKSAAEAAMPFPSRNVDSYSHRELDYPLEFFARMPAQRGSKE